MSVISLENMRFFSYHGFYDEEQILGGEYTLDISIMTDFTAAAMSDDLQKTVNYETVYAICDIEMREPRMLLETVVESIVESLKRNFTSLQAVEVKIRKLNPPLGGAVGAASVETAHDFASECGRCGKGIICYGSENCWCVDTKRIYPRTQELLARQFSGCFCKNCIETYAG